MKRNNTHIFILILLVFGLLYFIACTTKEEKPVINNAEQLKSFVNSAYEIIKEKGEKCYPEFRKRGGKWFHDDLYIFVWGLDGHRYVYPPNLDGEGENMLNLKDVSGKPIGKMFVEAVSGETGDGWVFYEWPKPGEDLPTWKSTYFKKVTTPDGTECLVASGIYNLKMEKQFIVRAVNNAAALLAKDRETAFEKFRSRSSEFIFLDTYVFVKDMKGIELVNPFSPELEGTNIYDLQDANGKYFVREELEILKTSEDCWMDYMWSKPGETEPSMKLVYVKKVKVGEDTLVVGAGYFPE
jgi:signal transduction histidine kinase